MITIGKTKLILNRSKLFNLMYFFYMMGALLFGSTNIADLLSVPVANFLEVVCWALFIIIAVILLMYRRTYTFNELLYIVIALIVFLISGYISESTVFIQSLIIMVCSKGIDFDSFGKFSLKLLTIIYIVTVVLAGTGLITNIVTRRNSEILRYSMGFDHANTAGILVFEWVCLYLYLKRDVLRFPSFVLSMFLILVVYLITNSNTMLFAGTLVVVLCFLYINFIVRGIKISPKTRRKILIFVFACAVLLIIGIVSYFIKNPWVVDFSTLRVRFVLINNYLDAYGVHLFGTKIAMGDWTSIPGYGMGSYWLDNGYFAILIQYGILTFAIFVLIYISYFKKLIKRNDWFTVIIVSCYLIYFLSETGPYRVKFNVFIIHMATTFYVEKNVSSRRAEELNHENVKGE